MKKLLLTIAISLVAFATGRAQYSQYGAIESLYQANPDLDTNQYAGRVVNPSYWLVDWGRWNEMDDRLVSNGFIRLGVSNWESDNAYGGGIPQRDLAMAYAQAIGAEAIIYATRSAADKYNYSEHLIGFYAQASVRRTTPAPTANDATWPDSRILTHAEHCVNAVAIKVKPNDTLKLRGGPGTRFNVVAEIPANANDISAFDQDQVWDGDTWWWPVQWHGFRGYIGRSYLSTAH